MAQPAAAGQILHSIQRSKEYRAIVREHGSRRAARSGVPYLNHLDEGLLILVDEGADSATMRAFAIHPLLQVDEDLARWIGRLDDLSDDPRVLVLAMEYRNIANGYLSTRTVAGPNEVDLGPLPEVAAMLRADKIQNYKDFLLHHRETHPRRAELDRYFRIWLARLGLSLAQFADWFERLQPEGARVPATQVL